MSTLPVITPEGEPAIAAPVAVLIMGHLIANFGGQKAFGFGYYRSFASDRCCDAAVLSLTWAVRKCSQWHRPFSLCGLNLSSTPNEIAT